MRRMCLVIALTVLLPVNSLHGQGGNQPPRGPLNIWFLDTEGGQATLLVTPTGQSMLIDTGFPGNQGMPGGTAEGPPMRDADRIMAVLKQANVTVLDYLVVTHYHGDHAGNAAELARRLPIKHFVDHGNYTVELQPGRIAAFASYQPVRHMANALVPRPGERIAITGGLQALVVSNGGEMLTAPIVGAPGSGANNLLCKDAKLKEQDPTPENYESVGLVLQYGAFRMLDLGDLTWNQEHQLVCPTSLIGTFDVFHTTRHGDPHSGATQLVHAIRARVAVMNNGERKGGDPTYWDIVHSAPGLQDFWQLHRSAAGGAQHNSPDQFLANVNETDHGHNIKLIAQPDGSFRVTNERTGFAKDYPGARGTSSAAGRH
jgi:competence protein ComEC